MNTRGFTPPDDDAGMGSPDDGERTLKEYEDGVLVENGEPDTIEDEFARDDASEQTYDVEEA